MGIRSVSKRDQINMKNHKKRIVNDILLARDHQGEIFIFWYPSIPKTVVETWVKDRPQPQTEVGPLHNSLNGVGGRIEMCAGIFRGLSQYCIGPKEMEADLWDQLQIMIDTHGWGTTVIAWGSYFNTMVEKTAHIPWLGPVETVQ